MLMTVLQEKTIARAPRQSTRQPARILRLDFDPTAKPDWVDPGQVLRVPVPALSEADSPVGRPLVWGESTQGRRLLLIALDDRGLNYVCPWADWEAHILLERYATWRRRPWHTYSPIGYGFVPASVRHLLNQRSARKPQIKTTGFPLPPFESGFEALRDLRRRYEKPATAKLKSRICLTHDIDTAEGFRWIKPIAEAELALGLRSSWNVVAGTYRIDYSILDWLVERGFEIGLHGFRHDNKLIYLSEPQMRRRLDRCRFLIERYDVQGFRSPSWLRNERLFRVLRDYVDYDCSCLDFDWYCPAGPGGVLTASPFRLGRLVEIPTTLPFEAPVIAGADPVEAPNYWGDKIRWILSVGGQAVVNAHPDPHYVGNPPMIRAYRVFLESLVDAFGGRWSLPRDLANEVSGDA